MLRRTGHSRRLPATACDRCTMPHPCRPCSVLTRVHAAYAAAKERAERAEAALELSEAALEQERAGAEAYKVPPGGWGVAAVVAGAGGT